MIIQCQNGRLLNAVHIVEWENGSTPDDKEQHTVIAKTILNEPVEIYRGTKEKCDIRMDEIYASLSEESTMLRHLCKGLAERDDKLSAVISRLIRTIK